jgi:hypothetical protein
MLEMVVLMTGVAAMLGLCVVLLQLLMKLDADSRSQLVGASTVARLSEQFRRDVHGARAAHLAEHAQGSATASGIQLDPGTDRTIVYNANGMGIVERVETRKGSRARRERYAISHGGTVRLSLPEESGRTFATLAIDREVASDGSALPPAVEVTALLAKNHDRDSSAVGAAGAKP